MTDVAMKIRREVLTWLGVEAKAHRFGGIEFRVLGHMIGHLHGESLADLPFPVWMSKKPVTDGKTQPHHVQPETGWASYSIRSKKDVPGALDLFRLNYERNVAREKDEAWA